MDVRSDCELGLDLTLGELLKLLLVSPESSLSSSSAAVFRDTSLGE